MLSSVILPYMDIMQLSDELEQYNRLEKSDDVCQTFHHALTS